MRPTGRSSFSIIAALLLAAAPRTPPRPGGVAVTRCDKRGARAVVFEGRVSAIRGARRMQMRFTLQARTPDDPTWAR